MRSRNLWCLFCIAVLIAFAAGCGDDDNGVKPDPDPTPYLPQSSPANCLANLITAYVERDLDEYLKLFSERFTFAFSPEDVAQDPTIPPQWGLVDERFATEGMFTSSLVDSIELQFSHTRADTLGCVYGAERRIWTERVTEIELRIHMRTQGGEYMLLRVTHGFGTFRFKPYPEETASDGQTLWRIISWEDQQLEPKGSAGEGASLTIDGTWGQLKHSFRPADLQTGACCLAGNYCLILTEVDCAGRGGEWQGVGVICDPNSCEPEPPVNTPPVACFGYTPRSGQVDTVFEFDAGCSSDLEDPVDSLEVRWDWEDDGVWDTDWTTGKVAEHRYDTPGEKAVRLQVRDTGGLTADTTKIVTIHPDPYLPQSSPANCLENLITAYVNRDIDEYLKLFPEDFTFVFSPEDVAQDPTIPAQWGLAEEREVHEGMFTSDIVDRIELQFTKSVADTSAHEFPDTWKASMTAVELRIHTRTSDGEYLLLKVSDGFGTFYFKEYPEETASDGLPLWRIWRWEDQQLGFRFLGEQWAKVEESTWGSVKAIFR